MGFLFVCLFFGGGGLVAITSNNCPLYAIFSSVKVHELANWIEVTICKQIQSRILIEWKRCQLHIKKQKNKTGNHVFTVPEEQADLSTSLWTLLY